MGSAVNADDGVAGVRGDDTDRVVSAQGEHVQVRDVRVRDRLDDGIVDGVRHSVDIDGFAGIRRREIDIGDVRQNAAIDVAAAGVVRQIYNGIVFDVVGDIATSRDIVR